MSNISTIYASEPALLGRLQVAAEAIRAALTADRRDALIREIDDITDALAERGLCRRRTDTSMLGSERARLQCILEHRT